MKLRIFDVEHGQCALLTCDNASRIMIDCGHSSLWRPGDYLRLSGISYLEQLIVTNYDEDHVSGLPNLLLNTSVGWLSCNRNVQPQTIRSLKTEDGMGRGIDTLVQMMQTHATPPSFQNPPPEFPGVVLETFGLSYPEFQDENNLSHINFIRLNGVGFLFPGDLEKEGWLALLERDSRFREILPLVNVLIASHHGRINGICADIFDRYGCNPYWIIISDKRHEYETQQTVPYYASKARGATFRGTTRNVLTTRRDGDIEFTFADGSWGAH